MPSEKEPFPSQKDPLSRVQKLRVFARICRRLRSNRDKFLRILVEDTDISVRDVVDPAGDGQFPARHGTGDGWVCTKMLHLQ